MHMYSAFIGARDSGVGRCVGFLKKLLPSYSLSFEFANLHVSKRLFFSLRM